MFDRTVSFVDMKVQPFDQASQCQAMHRVFVRRSILFYCLERERHSICACVDQLFIDDVPGLNQMVVDC
jgi:hypothetical protein